MWLNQHARCRRSFRIHTHTGLVALPRLLRWSEIKRRTFFSRHTVYQSISAVLQLQSASNYVSMSVTKIEEWHRHDEWSIKYESRRGSLCTVYIPVASNHSSCCLSVAYKRKCTHARTLQGNGHLPEDHCLAAFSIHFSSCCWAHSMGP